MKFQLDLLPNEYKSLPRDFFGMVFAVAAVAVCISWIMAVSARNFQDQMAVQGKIDGVTRRLNELRDEIQRVQPPQNEVENLEASINFINRVVDSPGTSWVEFLFALEASVPDLVYIKDINPMDFSRKNTKYTVQGEAASFSEMMRFISRLQDSGSFRDVFLIQNTTALSETMPVVQFTIEFVFTGRS